MIDLLNTVLGDMEDVYHKSCSWGDYEDPKLESLIAIITGNRQ